MRGTGFLRVIGRMKPGMTVEQVRAALPSLEQELSRTIIRPTSTAQLTTYVKTLPEDVTENLRAGFATLFAAVCFCVAHRVQQRRKSIAGSFQRAPPGDRAADGDRRVARAASFGFSFWKVCW